MVCYIIQFLLYDFFVQFDYLNIYFKELEICFSYVLLEELRKKLTLKISNWTVVKSLNTSIHHKAFSVYDIPFTISAPTSVSSLQSFINFFLRV